MGEEQKFVSHTMTFTGMRQSHEGPKCRGVERDSGTWVVNDKILQWRQKSFSSIWLVSKIYCWQNEIQRKENLKNHD